MKIKIQSVVDLITNSSTESFTILSDNAETLLTDVVNSVLRAGGSSLKFSDLFVYKDKYDNAWEDSYREYIEKFIEDHPNEYTQILLQSCKAIWAGSGWTPERCDAEAYIFKGMTDHAISNGAMNYYEFCEHENADEDSWERFPALKELNIQVKPGLLDTNAKIAADALNALQNLFGSDYRMG